MNNKIIFLFFYLYLLAIPLVYAEENTDIKVVIKAWCSSERYPFGGEGNCNEVWLTVPGYSEHCHPIEGIKPGLIDFSIENLFKLEFNPRLPGGAECTLYNIPVQNKNILWIFPDPSSSVDATLITYYKSTWEEFTCKYNFKLSKPLWGDIQTIGKWDYLTPARSRDDGCQKGSANLPNE